MCPLFGGTTEGVYFIVTLQDPGISNSQPRGQYPPYDMGLMMDVFITNSSGLPIVGQVSV